MACRLRRCRARFRLIDNAQNGMLEWLAVCHKVNGRSVLQSFVEG